MRSPAPALYKLSSDTLAIQASRELPLLVKDGALINFTIYNGLQVSSNGSLVLVASTSPVEPTGMLLLVDPYDLQVKAETDSEALASARLTLAADAESEYLYHTNATESLRFKVTPAGFELDNSWTASYRRTPTSPLDGAVCRCTWASRTPWSSPTTRCRSRSTPTQLFTQPTSPSTNACRAAGLQIVSAAGELLHGGRRPNPRWSSSRISSTASSPASMGDGAIISLLWETSSTRCSAGAAIAYEQGHLYIDDRRCDGAGANCRLFLVVLDLATSKKLAEIQVGGGPNRRSARSSSGTTPST